MPNPSTIAQEDAWATYREYRVILGLSKPYGGSVNTSLTVEIEESALLNFLEAYFAPIRDAFSVTIGYGYWKGKREGSATVSWIAADHVVSAADAHELARAWNRRHNQECSIVSWSPVEHFDFV